MTPYRILTTLAFFLCMGAAHQTNAQLTLLASGGNKTAITGERIGLVDVTVHYNRPGVKGREGQIWGKLVPVGFTDQGFGSSKAAPWRAGANENTTIEFSGDVKIEGQPLKAGKYGFFIAYDPNECTLIFSNNNSSWGSFYYNESEDALRVKVKPHANDQSVEWLRYEFSKQTENTAVLALEWEKLVIPFSIETNYTSDQVASFRRELRTRTGFNWEPWNTAAQWCLQRRTNLDEALLWTDSATSINFGGDRSFQAWSTKAQVLNALNRPADAEAVVQKALPFASMQELHGYARSLLAQKRTEDAIAIFKMNYANHPNVFTTNAGMARAFSAAGNYKKALEYLQKALPQAPDGLNKANVEKMIGMLKEGKDIN